MILILSYMILLPRVVVNSFFEKVCSFFCFWEVPWVTATPDDRSGATGGWCWSESGRRWQRDEVVRGGTASGF